MGRGHMGVYLSQVLGGRKGVAKGSVRGQPHMHVLLYVCTCVPKGHVFEHTCNCVIYVCVLACLGACVCMHGSLCKHMHAWACRMYVCMHGCVSLQEPWV